MNENVTPATPDRFIQIDEEGYFKFDETRVTDEDYGRTLLQGLYLDERGRTKCRVDSNDVWVEAFDEPLIAVNVTKAADGAWNLDLPYGHAEPFSLETLSLDEWDRFHGRTQRGLPFVFSRAAQAEFFNRLDEFDDESITAAGKTYPIGPWLVPNSDARDHSFWDKIYQTEKPGWELGQPHEALAAFVPKLKLSKSRILVLGAGSANDASYFAKLGHLVTAVDFSPEAIARAKEKYGDIPGLKFETADVFKLPTTMNAQFDIVFEHTLYCAIDPVRRNELTKVWRRVLAENGHLLGIFFAFDKRTGPPFGGTEWELRARLKNSFRTLYWMRWRKSSPNRMGKEFIVYAQKLALI